MQFAYRIWELTKKILFLDRSKTKAFIAEAKAYTILE